MGAFTNPPLMQPIVSPTTGVPSSVGGATATGDAGGVSPASTLTYRSRVERLPAESTATAVSLTTDPTAEAGGV